jgi:hypothetical protein
MAQPRFCDVALSRCPSQVRQGQLEETAAVLRGRVGDRKAWVSVVLAANWGAAARARAALHAALPDALRRCADPDAALYAEPQVNP